jgi:hypothetical protein
MMAEQKTRKVHSPTADAWDYAVAGFDTEEKLAGYKVDAIAESVEQAILLCEQVNAEHGRALVLKKAKKLQALFGNLVHELRSTETQTAITSVTADKSPVKRGELRGGNAKCCSVHANAVQRLPFYVWEKPRRTSRSN